MKCQLPLLFLLLLPLLTVASVHGVVTIGPNVPIRALGDNFNVTFSQAYDFDSVYITATLITFNVTSYYISYPDCELRFTLDVASTSAVKVVGPPPAYVYGVQSYNYGGGELSLTGYIGSSQVVIGWCSTTTIYGPASGTTVTATATEKIKMRVTTIDLLWLLLLLIALIIVLEITRRKRKKSGNY